MTDEKLPLVAQHRHLMELVLNLKFTFPFARFGLFRATRQAAIYIEDKVAESIGDGLILFISAVTSIIEGDSRLDVALLLACKRATTLICNWLFPFFRLLAKELKIAGKI